MGRWILLLGALCLLLHLQSTACIDSESDTALLLEEDSGLLLDKDSCPSDSFGWLHFGNRTMQGSSCYTDVPLTDDTSAMVSRWKLPQFSRTKQFSYTFHTLYLLAHCQPGRGGFFPKTAPTVRFCIHGNESAPLGYCSGTWKGLDSHGRWSAQRSLFTRNFLEVRWPAGDVPRDLSIAVYSGLERHRLGCFIAGMLLMPLAGTLSQLVVLYYGVGMSVGILLVIGIVLFQIMKLLPFTRGSGTKTVFLGAMLGMGGILVTWLSGLASEAAEKLGLGDSAINPLVGIGLAILCMVGAAMGFWFVRKLVVLPSGDLDPVTIVFVRGMLWAFSACLLIMSSSDAVFGALALLSGVTLTLLVHNFAFIRRKLTPRGVNLRIRTNEREATAELEESDIPGTPVRDFTRARSTSPAPQSEAYQNNVPSPGGPGSELERLPFLHQAFVSSFHHIGGRQQLTPADAKTVSRACTLAALKDLTRSPEFGMWASANMRRISILPDDSMHREHANREKDDISATAEMAQGPLFEDD